MARRKGSGGTGARLYVPGVWSGVIREARDREAESFSRVLDDPRQVFTLGAAELSRLRMLARKDAEQRFAGRFADGVPVTVGKALLRATALGVPADEIRAMMRGPFALVRVNPDDTVEPAEVVD